MGNANKPITPVQINQPVYTDPGARTLRQLRTFLFPQTVTGGTTVAYANSPPQITQGNELWNGVFTAASLESLFEVEISTNVLYIAGGAINSYVALFADYSPEALAVYPMGGTPSSVVIPVLFKHYFQPVTTGPVRYSLRFACNNGTIVANIYNYGGSRNSSRITFKEWTGQNLQNI